MVIHLVAFVAVPSTLRLSGMFVLFFGTLLLLFAVPTVLRGQDDKCCFDAYKSCSACKDDPDPAKRTENLTYSWCGVTGYYGQNPNSPNAPEKLKACQACIDRQCPVGKSGKPKEPEIDISKTVLVRPPDKDYSWCTNTLSSVWVEQLPAGHDIVNVMVAYDKYGEISQYFGVGERGSFPGRSVVIVPDFSRSGGPWRVVVYIGNYAQVEMESNSYIRLPCKTPATLREKIGNQIELLGGVSNWFLETLAMRDHPDFPELYEIQTKEAIAGIKDRKGEDGMLRLPIPDSGIDPAAGFSIVDAAFTAEPPRTTFFATPDFTIDTRTTGTTRFTVNRGSLEVRPINAQTKRISLRSGQSVDVTATTIGQIRTIAQQPSPSEFVGCFKDTSVFDLDGFLERSRTNTPEQCVANCRSRGFKFAGVQYGESCLCGNSYGKYGPAANCNMRCTGDPSKTCGGYSANSIYSTGAGTAGPEAAGCGLGVEWRYSNEYGSRGVWRRRGSSNVFDNQYFFADGSSYTNTLNINSEGNTVTAVETYQFGLGSCVFSGTFAPNGRSVSGTFRCDSQPQKISKWSAEIICPKQ